jgi:hypothetical protein
MAGTFVNITPPQPFSAPDLTRVAISPVSKVALVVGQRGSAVLIAPNNQVDPLATQTINDLWGASFMPDGSFAYISGANATLLKYDPANETVTRMDEAHMAGFSAIPPSMTLGNISFCPDGSYALLLCPEGRVFKVMESQISDISVDFEGLGNPSDVAWVPQAQIALITSKQTFAFVWNGSAQAVTQTASIPGSSLEMIAWRNTTAAYFVSQGSMTRLIRYSGPGVLSEVQQLGTALPRSICWRPDGKEGFVFSAGSPASTVFRCPSTQEGPVLTVSSITDTGAYLGWTWNGAVPLDHFSVYYSVSNATLFDTTPTNITNSYITLSSLTANRTYYAAVRAVLDTIPPENLTSNIVPFTTLSARPVPNPGLPIVSNVNATSAYFSWSWNPASSQEKLDHYLFFHSTSAVSLAQEIPINVYSNTSGTLSKLLPSTTYYMMIRVVTLTNRTADSPVQSFNTSAFIVPRSVGLTVSGNRLEWEASATPNITAYGVYFGAQMGSSVDQMTFLGTSPASTGGITYDLSGQMGTTLKEGTTYYFRVRTIHRDGGYADSPEESWKYDTAPSSVMGSKITDITYSSVRLSWSLSTAQDFDAYVIEYREYLSGSWKVATRVNDKNTTSAAIGSLAPDTRYQFRIKVQDKAGKSSPFQEWSIHPRTSENIPYTIFYMLVLTPEVCLPISLVLTFISIGIAVGASRGGRRTGRALAASAFAGGFGLVLLTNLAWVLGVFVLPLEMKVLLFLIPFPIAAAVGISRWSSKRAMAARQAEQMRRQQAEMAQQELRQRAENVRASLESLRTRIGAVEAMPKAPSAGPAREILQRAMWALQTGNILLAEDDGKKCAAVVSELESSAKDKQTQLAELTKRLDAIDGKMKVLIERWQRSDPATEMGLPPSRIDGAKLEAAKHDQDKRMQSAQASAQQAGLHLEKDRLPEAREAAAAAEALVERMFKSARDINDLKETLKEVKPALDDAAVWASLDIAAFDRRIESVKLALAYGDLDGAGSLLDGLNTEIGGIEDKYKPSLTVILVPSQYQVNRFEDFQFAVQNEGTALAQNIELSFEAPADFGPGDMAGSIKIPKLAAKQSQDCKINLCFNKEGKVPVIISVHYEDHNGYGISPDPIRSTAHVVKEGAPVHIAPQVPVAQKSNIIINARPILQGGFFLFKLAVVNHSGFGLADARVLISYKREVLRFHHISPPTLLDRFKYLQGEGEREDVFYLGYLDPMKDQEVSAELYFHPYICTETVIEAELCYRDVQGKKLSIDCEPKKFPCYCPTLGSTEKPNPAMLRSFMETAGVKDSRVEPINAGISLVTAFEVLKSAITNFGLTPVGTETVRRSPFHAEALFYGEEDADGKVLRYAVIGMVSQRPTSGAEIEVGGITEIHVACEARTKVTALLATLAEQFSSSLEKQVNIKRPIYVDMREYKTVIKDSIIYKSSIGAGHGDTEVEGSVLNRASVGSSGRMDISPDMPVKAKDWATFAAAADGKTKESMAKYHESYKRAKFNDGTIDEEEHAFLEHLATMYALSAEIVQAIENKVDQEYAALTSRNDPSPGPKCPRCGSPVKPGDVICSNCGDLLPAMK